MARISRANGQLKIEDGDKVTLFGVVGKVETVALCKTPNTPAHITLFVRFGNAECCNVLNLTDVEAVRFDGQWVNLKNEPVLVH